MRDGEIKDGYAWFRFDYQELEWLLHLIPPSDDFRDLVAEVIKKMEHVDDNAS